LIYNGEIVATAEFMGDRKSLDFVQSFRPERSGWFHVRVMGGRGEQFPMDITYGLALTNPVWVVVDGAPVRSAAAADYSIAWIDKLQQMAEAWTDWRSQREQDHVYAQFEEAREIYRQLKAEALPATSPGTSPPGSS
jgi:hypothetical protein